MGPQSQSPLPGYGPLGGASMPGSLAIGWILAGQKGAQLRVGVDGHWWERACGYFVNGGSLVLCNQALGCSQLLSLPEDRLCFASPFKGRNLALTPQCLLSRSFGLVWWSMQFLLELAACRPILTLVLSGTPRLGVPG